MKSMIAKEVLYFFVALIVAAPVSLFFLHLVDFQPAAPELSPDEGVLEMDLLLIGALLGFVGVYVIRLTIWAVKQLLGQSN
jgi:hypothetical protein